MHKETYHAQKEPMIGLPFSSISFIFPHFIEVYFTNFILFYMPFTNRQLSLIIKLIIIQYFLHALKTYRNPLHLS